MEKGVGFGEHDFFFVLSFPAGLSWNGLQKRGGSPFFQKTLVVRNEEV